MISWLGDERPKCYICKTNPAILAARTTEGTKPMCPICYEQLKKEWTVKMMRGEI